jgi:integrase
MLLRRFRTEPEARKALAEIIGAAGAGAFVARTARTVDELCGDWLASLHNARATTLSAYAYALAPLRERHGRLPVQQLTRAHLDRLLADLRDGGTVTAKGRARQPWAPRSLNKSVDAWRALLDYGVECAELPRNVAAGIKKVARVRREMATYTPEEIDAVLRAAEADRNEHLWYLALSGLRRGEIAGLMWSDIDLVAGTLTIDRQRVQAGAGNVVENDPKTVSSCRTLPLDESLVSVLRRARLASPAGSDYVAVGEDGQPYTPDTLTRMWRKHTRRAGVRVIRLHDARHSCGTALHLRGVPLAVIAKWLGHADAETTARIYAHSQDDALVAAGRTLGQVVSTSCQWGSAGPAGVSR